MDEGLTQRHGRLGTITVVASARGIRMVAFTGAGDTCLPFVTGTTPLLTEAHAQLAAYTTGRLRCFDLPLELPRLTPFTQAVLDACAQLPWGTRATYRDLATLVGKPGATRAVGGALGRNPVPILIPCHRVISAHGIGGYTPGVDLKKILLAIES